MQISRTTRTSPFIYPSPFRVYRLTRKFHGTFRGQWSNLVCGRQTGFVRGLKSRCNKCIRVVHLATTRGRGGGGGERKTEREGEKKRETRNLVFVARSPGASVTWNNAKGGFLYILHGWTRPPAGIPLAHWPRFRPTEDRGWMDARQKVSKQGLPFLRIDRFGNELTSGAIEVNEDENHDPRIHTVVTKGSVIH